MSNHTGVPQSTQPHDEIKPRKKPHGFWDFLLPAILGGVVYTVVSTCMQIVGPRAMAPSTYFGGLGAIALIVVIGLMIVVPVVALFIKFRVGVKMLLIFWPTVAALISLLTWIFNHASIPI